MWALLHGRRHAIMLATVTESLFAEILPQRPGLADQSGRPDATK
jgi:hypothetical protein